MKKSLKIKLFLDGADFNSMKEANRLDVIKGFTTNPTLMKKAGVTDYEGFAKSILKEIPTKPISFEVFSDDFSEMEKQAQKIASWGPNVYVKVPITNTKGETAGPLIRQLAGRGTRLNVTAILTVDQVRETLSVLNPQVDSIISVFAGRIADTGVDPMPAMKESVALAKTNRKAEVLWASSREALNVYQADSCGCQIITVTSDILKKMGMQGKSLSDLSLDTVKMFYQDGLAAGFKL